ncbi:Zinc finger protein CONSTANS-LIKE 4 [Zea mays]|uniref:Zinc finger protein CONSTANS-LIKE 4 n=1 Tax=Zea mays TaxID=4577 RepID=A0A3L6EZV0_MAIZE|nr:Zinc finger protein CONSTANS-LIKE 4 [Zea mays]
MPLSTPQTCWRRAMSACLFPWPPCRPHQARTTTCSRPDDVDAAAPEQAQGLGSPRNGSSSASFTTSGDSGAEGSSLFDFDLLSGVDLAACVTDGVAPLHHDDAAPLWAQPGLAVAWATAWSPAGSAAAVVAAAAEREARVQRYREKRKNRRFHKTIRYASRKAYAEVRPRIKGRFVKRAAGTSSSSSGAGTPDDGNDATRAAAKFWLSFSDDARDGFYVDAGAYGVVPSF